MNYRYSFFYTHINCSDSILIITIAFLLPMSLTKRYRLPLTSGLILPRVITMFFFCTIPRRLGNLTENRFVERYSTSHGLVLHSFHTKTFMKRHESTSPSIIAGYFEFLSFVWKSLEHRTRFKTRQNLLLKPQQYYLI